MGIVAEKRAGPLSVLEERVELGAFPRVGNSGRERNDDFASNFQRFTERSRAPLYSAEDIRRIC